MTDVRPVAPARRGAPPEAQPAAAAIRLKVYDCYQPAARAVNDFVEVGRIWAIGG